MKKYYFTLILSILISSCSDEPMENINENDIKPSADFVLVAGQVFNDSITYHEFDPALIVRGNKIESDTGYYYRDSLNIDLNSDGINDLDFYYHEEYYEPSCDCQGIDCCQPWGEMRSTVRTLSDVEIAVMQHPQYNDMIVPAIFGLGDTLQNHLQWENSPHARIINAWGLTTLWDDTYLNSFIGFRFVSGADTTYGWVRMNTSNSTMIKLYDYAIENTSN